MKKRRIINVIIPLVIMFSLMTFVLMYGIQRTYNQSVNAIYSEASGKLRFVAKSLDNYLVSAKSVLWVTADSVDEFIKNGEPNSEISEYLVKESANQKESLDENILGLYGYVNGEYLDGLNWVPPEGYEPTERDWYKEAIKGNGESVLVPPYLDAQTGEIIISFARMLPNGEGVMAVDISMDHINELLGITAVNGMGYNYIVDDDGFIVAHSDETLKFKQLADIYDVPDDYFDLIHQNEGGSFETVINGEKVTVFTASVIEHWHMVVVTSKKDLFRQMRNQFVITSSVYLIVFALVCSVSIASYLNENRMHRDMEGIKANEQKKEYEAELLKIEKESAIASNKAKGNFLALMSHEIRTPINAIIGMNEMILRECKDENIVGYSKHIKYSSSALLGMVNSILDFSKIEEGKMEIVPVKYSPANVIRQLTFVLKQKYNKETVEFITDIDENIPCELIGDDLRISQVISNLLTNAFKYTATGSVTLTVKEIERNDNIVTLFISVRDTGRGIKQEDYEKLFESFKRIDEKETRNIEGTGLGMSIVARLLELMDSKIEVQSEYEKGTEFSFKLKQTIANPNPMGSFEELKEVIVEEGTKNIVYVPKASILVVDDNDMNRVVAKNLLKQNGIVPDLAESGEEAIEKIKAIKYDIVFLDHMMPKMDGIETFKKLQKENLIGEGTTVIALTANAISGSREKYLALGFDDYMSKPIDSKELESKLEQYIPKDLLSVKEETIDTEKKEDKKENDTFVSPVNNNAHKEAPVVPEHTENSIEFDNPSDVIESIRQLGVGVGAGLYYCGSDENFYLNLLCDYANGFDKNSGEISKLLDDKNWEEYSIKIHELKSMSRTIGAQKLYNDAGILEDAAKEGDEAAVKINHILFIEDYRTLTERMRRVLDL